MASDRRLFSIADLPDPGARAFRVGSGDWPLRGFVVRRGRDVWAYVNRCPHAGHPLDGLPGRFILREGPLVQCASHGALFAVETGKCVAGPCAGRGLVPITVSLSGDEVMLVEDPDLLAQRYA